MYKGYYLNGSPPAATKRVSVISSTMDVGIFSNANKLRKVQLNANEQQLEVATTNGRKVSCYLSPVRDSSVGKIYCYCE